MKSQTNLCDQPLLAVVMSKTVSLPMFCIETQSPRLKNIHAFDFCGDFDCKQ